MGLKALIILLSYVGINLKLLKKAHSTVMLFRRKISSVFKHISLTQTSCT